LEKTVERTISCGWVVGKNVHIRPKDNPLGVVAECRTETYADGM